MSTMFLGHTSEAFDVSVITSSSVVLYIVYSYTVVTLAYT